MSVDRQSPLWLYWYKPVASEGSEDGYLETPEPWLQCWQQLQLQEKTHAAKATQVQSPLEQYLKRHVEGAKWLDIKAIPGERILKVTLSRLSLSGEAEIFYMMLELTPKYANFFLLDDAHCILTASRFITMADNRTRQQLMHQPYQPPPQPEGRLSLETLGMSLQRCTSPEGLDAMPDAFRHWVEESLSHETLPLATLRRHWLSYLRQTVWGATADVLRQAIRYGTQTLTEGTTYDTTTQKEAFLKVCWGLHYYRAWMLSMHQASDVAEAPLPEATLLMERSPLWCLIPEGMAPETSEPEMLTAPSTISYRLTPMGMGQWFKPSEASRDERFEGFTTPQEALLQYLTQYWKRKAYDALYQPLHRACEKLETQLQTECDTLLTTLDAEEQRMAAFKEQGTRLLWAYNTQQLPELLEANSTLMLPAWDTTLPPCPIVIEHRCKPTHLAERLFEKAKKRQKQQEGRYQRSERLLVQLEALQQVNPLREGVSQWLETASWDALKTQVKQAWLMVYHVKRTLNPAMAETPKKQRLLQQSLGTPAWVLSTQKQASATRHGIGEARQYVNVSQATVVAQRYAVSDIVEKYLALYQGTLEGVPETLLETIKTLAPDAMLVLWIGKHQKSNHYLLTKIARPEDRWLHHAHQPSGHAIARLEGMRAWCAEGWETLEHHHVGLMRVLLTEVAWQWAVLQPSFEASLHTPRTFLDTLPVIHCAMKHVRLIPNHVGLVQYSHEKRL